MPRRYRPVIAGTRAGSGRQAVAALGTAALEYEAATLRRHAGAKTMGALAFQVAGLKGAFHCLVPVRFDEWPAQVARHCKGSARIRGAACAVNQALGVGARGRAG